jgi:hypothetical protein
MSRYDDPLDRARALWDWKDLSRGVSVSAVTDAVSTAELKTFADLPPGEAVDQLGRHLVTHDALQNRTVVTPAFLLHLTASDADSYSTIFPIFDVRCWVAYVYLSGFRDTTQPLPKSATTSAARFAAFSTFFQRTLPESIPGRVYEQALFKFGAYISGLRTTTIGEVDTHLQALESAVTACYDATGVALVRTQSPDADTAP